MCQFGLLQCITDMSNDKALAFRFLQEDQNLPDGACNKKNIKAIIPLSAVVLVSFLTITYTQFSTGM